MKVVAGKMLQMRAWLKSNGALLRRKAALAMRRARERLLYWRAGRSGEVEAAKQQAVAQGWRSRHPRLFKVLRIAAIAIGAYVVLPYILIPIYRFVDPPFSALMVRQTLRGADIRQEWVDFEDISPHLVRAVVLAEDASFCRHYGVDWGAVSEAIEAAEDGDMPRGASTIPMQTAKNLFLWSHQDYLRKALELPLAYYLSALWPKQRVIEVYLNVTEWGPGIFGAEAAARYHFGKSAAALTPGEAALLAAALPNPIRRNAGRPGPQLSRLAAHIQARAGREAQDVACVFD